MASAHDTTLLGRMTALLSRGPASAPDRTSRERLRHALRTLLLRGARRYFPHQHELDTATLDVLQLENARLRSVYERHAEQIERLEGMARELIVTAESLRRGVEETFQVRSDLSALRSDLTALRSELQALPYVAGSPFELRQSPLGEVLEYRAPAANDAGGGYVAFEDLFRGPTERVAELQRPYLDLVVEHQPVLDVGCGRGEFLALLASAGIAGRGIDTNAGMVARCAGLGLDATRAEANAHLSTLEDGALGSIFSAQVVEHLPHAELGRFLELARRKLRPGGLLIAETVNPHHLPALKTFWVDLTHQHPIFPEVALALCRNAGFPSAYVFAPGHDSFERARFSASAYAVVATAGPAVGARS